ncbi:MAG TPA: hypothetical protein PL126_01580 [Candidatus Cloacimonadota bacterium]|nr:hypothetical protein [Candidatus Cloacimonadota bacterium]
MKHLKTALLLLFILSLALVLHGQNVASKSTKYYKVSYPEAWEVQEIDENVFTAFAKGNPMIPLTLAIVVTDIDEEDAEKGLTALAEEMLEESGEEFEEMGLEPEIDIEISEETRLNGIPTYHYTMSVGIMGLTTHTENYLFQSGQKLIVMSVVGAKEDLEENAEAISEIFKSFRLTKTD